MWLKNFKFLLALFCKIRIFKREIAVGQNYMFWNQCLKSWKNFESWTIILIVSAPLDASVFLRWDQFHVATCHSSKVMTIKQSGAFWEKDTFWVRHVRNWQQTDLGKFYMLDEVLPAWYTFQASSWFIF